MNSFGRLILNFIGTESDTAFIKLRYPLYLDLFCYVGDVFL